VRQLIENQFGTDGVALMKALEASIQQAAE
jgi:hypothetical protein